MVIELGGSVFEFTHDLVGDLFRAKNAGVTTNFSYANYIVMLSNISCISSHQVCSIRQW
jgi:hypothetical protein